MIPIGAVPYLNGKPLVSGLGHEPGIELTEHVPSVLARMLAASELAVGLVSSAACFSNPGLEIVPGIGVCSTGPVESVKIFLRDSIDSVRRVALDTSSLTSVLLARIILIERYGLEPEFVDMPPSVDDMLADCDAAVLIGDPAMRVPSGRWLSLDLGEEWHRLTGLPFVFAVWAVNPSLATPLLLGALQDAKARGLGSLHEISQSESVRLQLPYETCYHYLTEIMQYDLGEQHWEGLLLFQSKARSHGFIPEGSDLRRYAPVLDGQVCR